jgi:hypothetical protein
MTDQDGKGLFQSLPLARPAALVVRELEEALILPGDRIPELILPGVNAQLQRFYELVRGRPTVLVLVANTARQEQWDEIKGYADIAPALDAAGVDLFIVTNDGVESMAMVSKAIPAPAIWLADIRGVVNLALRTGAKFAQTGVVSFVLDADQRVIALKGAEPGQAAWAFSVVRKLPDEAPLVHGAIAPVLILPRVLDDATCRQLLALEGLGSAPAPIPDAALAASLSRLLLRRVGPEVDKVFSFDDFQFEALLLQQEEARPAEDRKTDRRRDNSDPETLGRSFSLILDLEAEAYQGGGLRFPEYGPHLYRPGTGAAVVHAGEMLREQAPIESGRRSLLTLTLRRPPKASAQPKPIS